MKHRRAVTFEVQDRYIKATKKAILTLLWAPYPPFSKTNYLQKLLKLFETQQPIIYNNILHHIKEGLIFSLLVKVYKRSKMKNKNILFWIFASLKNISLGVIIFLLFSAFGKISNTRIIGLDTLILLSVLFPLMTLIVEYIFFAKIKNRG